MYGTIMRGRVKAGRRAEFERLFQEVAPDHVEHGLHSIELAREDTDPDRVVVIIHFTDRESYRRNADRPETDRDYRRQLELLDGEPEWIDVEFGGYLGKPLTTSTVA